MGGFGVNRGIHLFSFDGIKSVWGVLYKACGVLDDFCQLWVCLGWIIQFISLVCKLTCNLIFVILRVSRTCLWHCCMKTLIFVHSCAREMRILSLTQDFWFWLSVLTWIFCNNVIIGFRMPQGSFRWSFGASGWIWGESCNSPQMHENWHAMWSMALLGFMKAICEIVA